MRNGVTYFCKPISVTGTHFERKTCATATQLELNRERQQDTRDALRAAPQTNPSGSLPPP